MTRSRRFIFFNSILTALLVIGIFSWRSYRVDSTNRSIEEPVAGEIRSKSLSNEVSKITRELSPDSAPEASRAPEPSPQAQRRLSPDEEVQSWGAPILEGEVKLDASRSASVRIYRTPMKYPLIMVQELWSVSSSDPSARQWLGERKMVADHLLVRLHDGHDLAAFESQIAREGMRVRKKMYARGLYLVSFPVEAVDSFQKTQKRLSEMPEVRSATPDIFGRGF